MSITEAPLTTNIDLTFPGNAATTASIAPTANSVQFLVLMIVWVTQAQAQDPDHVTGGGVTWVKIDSIIDTAAGVTFGLYRAMSASPGSGAVTMDAAPNSHCYIWAIAELAGVDTSGANGSGAVVQSNKASNNTGAVNTVTPTLAAFGSVNNGAFCVNGYFNASALPTAAPDAGWAEIHETGSLLPSTSLAASIETQWRPDNDTTPKATWTLNGAVYSIAVEVKAAAGGGPTDSGLRLQRLLRPSIFTPMGDGFRRAPFQGWR